VSQVTTGIRWKLPGFQNETFTPNTGMKALEVIGTFKQIDSGQQPIHVDRVFVAQDDKNSAGVTGIGLMSGGQCSYVFPGYILKGFMEISVETAGQTARLRFGREQKTDPMTFTLKTNPCQVCFAFIVPEEMKGDVSLYFVDMVVPLSIK
jgi:hypothetical protein